MRWIYRHPRLYDLLDSLISMSLSDRVRSRFLTGLKVRTALEVGVGSGKGLMHTESRLPIGLDRSRNMLRRAKSRFPGAQMIMADAHRLPFEDGTIDVSIFTFCLAVLSKPLEAIREALRVSRKVVVIDYDRPTVIPYALWRSVCARLGWWLFGSRDIDFESVEALAVTAEVRTCYRNLYRVIVLTGADDAGN